MFKIVTLYFVLGMISQPTSYGLPSAPGDFCKTYPEVPACLQNKVDCAYCHPGGATSARNPYSQCLTDEVKELGVAFFGDDAELVLRNIEDQDCDGDGHTNLAEIQAGFHPGDEKSKPTSTPPPAPDSCEARNALSDWNVCGYDYNYAFKKVHIDFCGKSPSYQESKAFKSLDSDNERKNRLHQALDSCLKSENWLSKDGILWRMAHEKLRPVRAIKSGPEGGDIPLGDYFDDYNMFVFINSGDRDVRDLLLAQYFVERQDNPTVYTKVSDLPPHAENGGVPAVAAQALRIPYRQVVPVDKRAGLLTTNWNTALNTMFGSLPRSTAARAVKAFLGIDLALAERLNDLYPPAQNGQAYLVKDHDSKGIDQAACAFCHNALDPISYPFTSYNGLSVSLRLGRNLLVPGMYNQNRIAILAEQNKESEPNLAEMPEAGYLFGKKVENLVEWAKVAADSDDFAKTIVNNFMIHLKGRAFDDTLAEQLAYEKLWKDLKEKHQYQVEKMLHDFITTEVYGAP
jgi:hypothetical protein